MYIPHEDVEKAKKIDLFTYLKVCEPQELVRVSADVYCTREHDSLRISNGKWCWFSRGIGGKNAIDYLMEVRGCDFITAVNTVLGRSFPELSDSMTHEKKPSSLIVPELSKSTDIVHRYLMQRGINTVFIDYCVENNLLFETKNYHSALFIGYDKGGIARYGFTRGTNSAYKGELAGSDKRFSFSLCPGEIGGSVHVFESAIDAMSFATLELIDGKAWRNESLLSLAGVFTTKRKDLVPAALSQFLKDNPGTDTVHLHLDNDKAGQEATRGIIQGLRDSYVCLNEPPDNGKDVNDQLKMRIGIAKREVKCR